MDEMINYDEIVEDEVDVVETEEEATGISTGAAIAIGAGLAVAVGAAIKFAKKLWEKHKAKKELNRYEGDKEITDEELEEITN